MIELDVIMMIDTEPMIQRSSGINRDEQYSFRVHINYVDNVM
jgi:hypothetical protein